MFALHSFVSSLLVCLFACLLVCLFVCLFVCLLFACFVLFCFVCVHVQRVHFVGRLSSPTSGRCSVWNPLYLRTDAAVKAMAQEYGVKEGDILDRDSENLATRAALVETHIIKQTKTFLQQVCSLPAAALCSHAQDALGFKRFPIFSWSRTNVLLPLCHDCLASPMFDCFRKELVCRLSRQRCAAPKSIAVRTPF